MQEKERKGLRRELVRLHQAIEEFKDVQKEAESGARPAAGGAKVPHGSTQWFLENAERNRRLYSRVGEKCVVDFTVALAGEEEMVWRPDRAYPAVEYVRSLYETARTGRPEHHVSPRSRMVVHLQRLKDELVYFILFTEASDAERIALPLLEMELSGSGMALPTVRRHEAGRRLFVVLFPPTDPYPPVKMRTEVVRPSREVSTRSSFLTPLKIADISEEDHLRLVKFLQAEKTHRMLQKAYRPTGTPRKA